MEAPEHGSPGMASEGGDGAEIADGPGTVPSPPDAAPNTARAKGRRSREERAADREARRIEAAEAKGDEDAKPKGRTRKPASLEKRLKDSLEATAFLVGMLNAADGAIIGANAESMAHAWDTLAQESPAVYRALVAMMTGSSWAGVVMATAPVALGIMANHEVGPFGRNRGDGGGTESDGAGETLPPDPTRGPWFGTPDGAILVADRAAPVD